VIHVFFDCGSFGSTIEYVLHNYTNHENKIDGHIMSDGSMHSFKKEYHITDTKQLSDFLSADPGHNSITTPNYPFKEFKLPALIEYFSTVPSWESDKKILIYQQTLEQAELNLLFKYHKVCTSYINAGIGVLFGDNKHNLAGWNQNYTHWSQMQAWELREWFSIFYPGWLNEFTTAPTHVSNDWLVITNVDVLHDTVNTFGKIIKYCDLEAQGDIKTFVKQWQQAQQYIVDEFDLIEKIVNCSVTDYQFEWAPINIIAESVVQQRLRLQGYEIKCDGLNTFPTDSRTLYKLLEKQ